MWEITARTKPRVYSIIILLFKVPSVWFCFCLFPLSLLFFAFSFHLCCPPLPVIHFSQLFYIFFLFLLFPPISRFTSTRAHLPSSVFYLSRFFLSLGAGGRSSHPPHLPLSAFPRSSLYFSSEVHLIALQTGWSTRPGVMSWEWHLLPPHSWLCVCMCVQQKYTNCASVHQSMRSCLHAWCFLIFWQVVCSDQRWV